MFLRKALVANAMFSAACGIVCLGFSGPIAAMIGELPPLILVVLGVGLLIFAADVYWVSRKLPDAITRAKMIFYADIGWVVLTPVFILAFLDKLSSTGVFLLIDIAFVVAIFALLEWRGLKKIQSLNQAMA